MFNLGNSMHIHYKGSYRPSHSLENIIGKMQHGHQNEIKIKQYLWNLKFTKLASETNNNSTSLPSGWHKPDVSRSRHVEAGAFRLLPQLPHPRNDPPSAGQWKNERKEFNNRHHYIQLSLYYACSVNIQVYCWQRNPIKDISRPSRPVTEHCL